MSGRWQLVAQGDGSNFTEDIMAQYGNQFAPRQNGRLELKFADTTGISELVKYISDNVVSGVQNVKSAMTSGNSVRVDFTESTNVALPVALVAIFMWLVRIIPLIPVFLRTIFPFFRSLLPYIAGWFIWKWVEDKAPQAAKDALDTVKGIVGDNLLFFGAVGLFGIFYLTTVGSSSKSGSTGSAQTIIIER